VNLKGQLSNPREKLEALAAQRSRARRRAGESQGNGSTEVGGVPGRGPGEEAGAIQTLPSRAQFGTFSDASNGEITEMLAAYLVGDRVIDRGEVRGEPFDGHRPCRSERTVSQVRSRMVRADLHTAADVYAEGESLAAVGRRFGLDASTVANRFRRAGLPVRPRRGWA